LCMNAYKEIGITTFYIFTPGRYFGSAAFALSCVLRVYEPFLTSLWHANNPLDHILSTTQNKIQCLVDQGRQLEFIQLLQQGLIKVLINDKQKSADEQLAALLKIIVEI